MVKEKKMKILKGKENKLVYLILSPVQYLPPYLGCGASHSLTDLLVPPPHDREQGLQLEGAGVQARVGSQSLPLPLPPATVSGLSGSSLLGHTRTPHAPPATSEIAASNLSLNGNIMKEISWRVDGR